MVVALGMGVFLAFLGLTLDGGRAYLEQGNLQRAADLGALSAGWSYYHANYQDSDAMPTVTASTLGAVDAVVSTVLGANGYPGATLTRGPEGAACPAQSGTTRACVTFTDASGGALPNQCNPTCPGPTEVRGVGVRLTQVIPTQLFSALGGGGTTVAAASTAVLGSNTGARFEAPLLLQNYVAAGNALPRVNPYPAPCPVLGDGATYPLSPDCRPSTGAPWPAQPFNLVPTWEAAPPAGSGVFATAPKATFSLLHDDPSSAASPALVSTVQAGIPTVVMTCLSAPCPAAAHYFTDTAAPAAPDPVWSGLNGRISDATAVRWAGQACAAPLDPVHPLAPDNPRLLRLPVTYTAPSGGQAYISETVMFCLDSFAGASTASNYTISGYLVETASAAPTVLAAGSAYFGRDVTVNLVR